MFDPTTGSIWISTQDGVEIRSWGIDGDLVLPLGVEPMVASAWLGFAPTTPTTDPGG